MNVTTEKSNSDNLINTQTDKERDTNTVNGQFKKNSNGKPSSGAEDGNYWQSRYEKLLDDYNHLQRINQNLEEKLLNIVESFEKKKEELLSNIEYEKKTLMTDVNKLSTKLVDARIKLHDYEEKEMIHASECNSPCHKDCANSSGLYKSTNSANANVKDQAYDPNLV